MLIFEAKRLISRERSALHPYVYSTKYHSSDTLPAPETFCLLLCVETSMPGRSAKLGLKFTAICKKNLDQVLKFKEFKNVEQF